MPLIDPRMKLYHRILFNGINSDPLNTTKLSNVYLDKVALIELNSCFGDNSSSQK